jgi:hypothetical protein
LPTTEASDDFLVPPETSDIQYISSSSPQLNQLGIHNTVEDTHNSGHTGLERPSLPQSDSEPLFYPASSSSSSDIVEIVDPPKRKEKTRDYFDSPRRIFDGINVPMRWPHLVPNGTRIEKEREGQPRPPLKYGMSILFVVLSYPR